MSTVVDTLSSFVSSLRYEDLPPEVVYQAKRLIIDTMGCALGGYASETSRIAHAIAQTVTSSNPATVIGSGLSTSPDLACYESEMTP